MRHYLVAAEALCQPGRHRLQARIFHGGGVKAGESVDRTMLRSGSSSAFGAMISRTCAVCGGVVLNGCAPALRSADSLSTRGHLVGVSI